MISRALLNAPFFIPKDADLLRNRKVNTKKRQNRHLPLEFSIAMLACRNWTNQEIAEYLGLSMNTVKHYVSGILEKLGIDKRDKIKNFVNQ